MTQSVDTIDYAEPFRRDIRQFPLEIVLAAAKRHVINLKALTREVPDCEKAIDDVEQFIRECQHS